ncbi:c-type cytochrome [Nannocystaceae bacterium ST9]
MSRSELCLALVVLSGCGEKTPHFTEPMTLGGRVVQPETLERGRDLYGMHCVSCHGEDGSGNGPAAKSLKFPPRDFREAAFSFAEPDRLPSHEQLIEAIAKGVPDRGMPPWKGMNEGDLAALADFIKTFSPRWRAVPVPGKEAS